jgi:lysophospholipid acyltransferase (LPLAT)-like uncharacterized protein
MAQMLRMQKSRSNFKILVSQSRDGEITTRGVTAMGFSIVRGSTGKGQSKRPSACIRLGCAFPLTPCSERKNIDRGISAA